jgi:uroporphyrinogen decarboxylase
MLSMPAASGIRVLRIHRLMSPARANTAMSKTHTATLTGQQRVIRMLRRQDHDRVPRFEAFWDETLPAWRDQGMTGTPADRFSFDFHRLVRLQHGPYPGRRDVISQDGSTRLVVTSWGSTERQMIDRSGAPEHHGFACEDRHGWAALRPRVLSLEGRLDVAELRRSLALGRQAGRYVYVAGFDPFGCIRRLIGDEVMLMAMADDPQWIADMATAFTDQELAWLQAMLDAGVEPDGLWNFGDMGFSTGPMCSPAMYRDLVWPQHRRVALWCHQHNWPYIYHTDGDVRSCVPLYVEAQIDCIHPLEAKAGMDVRSLAPSFGERISFLGNIDVTVLLTGDLAAIEHEVVSKLAAGMAHRGYGYHSDHSLPPQVTWAVFQQVMALLDRHGWYD